MFDRSRASRRAVACPIPLDAPVISITRGWRLLGSVPIARPLWFGSCAAPTASARLAFQTANQMEPDVAPAMTHPDAGATPSPRKVAALELFSGLPRRYDALSAAFSFGQDPRWRRELARLLAPARGARVLDVATGTGLVAAELLARYDVSIVAVDQSEEMLAAARRRFDARTTQVELVQAQAEALP